MPSMQEQDSLFTTVHSLRSQIIVPGNSAISFDVFQLLNLFEGITKYEYRRSLVYGIYRTRQRRASLRLSCFLNAIL